MSKMGNLILQKCNEQVLKSFLKVLCFPLLINDYIVILSRKIEDVMKNLWEICEDVNRAF